MSNKQQKNGKVAKWKVSAKERAYLKRVKGKEKERENERKT